MFIPQKPRPSDEEKDGRLIATMTDKVPAPEYSIEICSRTCQRPTALEGHFRARSMTSRFVQGDD